MVIKPSSAAEIRPLVEALGGPDDVRREAAIARLAIIGPRATGRLVRAYTAAVSREQRGAILQALEPMVDARALPLARHALSEGGDLAVRAAALLRTLLSCSDSHSAAEALDLLVALALDASAGRRARVAAVEALQETSEDIRTRVREALGADPILDTTESPRPPGAAAEAAVWQDALEGNLPDNPAALRAALQSRAAAAPLAVLQRLVDAIRLREQEPAGAARRTEWLALRGSVHQALALRGSRVALYDLRESLEGAARPLPVSFLAALQVLGDASCLEPLAGACAATDVSEGWRYQLAAAFRAIARRERITRRHAAMKRIAARWPQAARDLGA